MLPLVIREKEVVVGKLGILAIQAEFQHQAGAGGLELVQGTQEWLVLAEELLVSWDDFHVRHNDVGGMELLVLGHDAPDVVALLTQPSDLAVEVDGDAQFVYQPLEA